MTITLSNQILSDIDRNIISAQKHTAGTRHAAGPVIHVGSWWTAHTVHQVIEWEQSTVKKDASDTNQDAYCYSSTKPNVFKGNLNGGRDMLNGRYVIPMSSSLSTTMTLVTTNSELQTVAKAPLSSTTGAQTGGGGGEFTWRRAGLQGSIPAPHHSPWTRSVQQKRRGHPATPRHAAHL